MTLTAYDTYTSAESPTGNKNIYYSLLHKAGVDTPGLK